MKQYVQGAAFARPQYAIESERIGESVGLAGLARHSITRRIAPLVCAPRSMWESATNAVPGVGKARKADRGAKDEASARHLAVRISLWVATAALALIAGEALAQSIPTPSLSYLSPYNNYTNFDSFNPSIYLTRVQGSNGQTPSPLNQTLGGPQADPLATWYYWKHWGFVLDLAGNPAVVTAMSTGGTGASGSSGSGDSGSVGAIGGTVSLTNYRNLTTLGPQPPTILPGLPNAFGQPPMQNAAGIPNVGTVYGLQQAPTVAGIYVASTGGDGGSGGSNWGFVATGGNGANGGPGGSATVTNNAWIATGAQNSPGIAAQSVGGGGGSGGSSSAIDAHGGSGGGSGDGGSVTVTNTLSGSIQTGGSISPWGYDNNLLLQQGSQVTLSSPNSPGIIAQSIGGAAGGGGTGGWYLTAYGSGGGGGSGGAGGSVTVVNNGGITTSDVDSAGVMAQSIGGGGGVGGSSRGIGSVGGSGSAGGAGGTVNVTNTGSIIAAQSRGVEAQSVGGGGGDGGTSGGLVSIGGSGSVTSAGGSISVTNDGTIQSESTAIFAQSVGGGGGSGGSTVGLVSIGGTAGGGGSGGDVTVSSNIIPLSGVVPQSGTVNTTGHLAGGIEAQSVGGGGGHGGAAVAGGFGGAVAIGGSGGSGGSGGNVGVSAGNFALITTYGETSYGIFAQSVGGGGGSGGVAVAGSIPAYAVSASVGIGGTGGSGGGGGMVNVTYSGAVTTSGAHATGVLAQSVGGGGGAGGFSVAATLGTGYSASVALGGKAGGGGNGNSVSFTSTGYNTIATSGVNASGIVAQSVGGGGGHGGFSVAANAGAVAAVSVGLGGAGGSGGNGGDVTLTSSSTVTTQADNAYGILAQSVGGGGGAGGFNVSGNIAPPAGSAATVSLGGSGGLGGSAGAVTVNTTSAAVGSATDESISGPINTYGNNASAILAQSVGGGGGTGGLSVSGTVTGTASLGFSLGGSGGVGGSGNTVSLTSKSVGIITKGHNSSGIVAQSIGGGGGVGGISVAASLGVTVTSAGLAESFGGQGGVGGVGGSVALVTNDVISTGGNHAPAIFAQSVGGGGGKGGFSGAFALAPTAAVSVSLGGNGGSGNTAGSVSVTAGDSTAGLQNISTLGAQSPGIFAQSVGGGGGSGGTTVAVSAAWKSEIPNAVSLTIGGSGGTGSNADTVTVSAVSAKDGGYGTPTTISTSGDHSAAIYAQSVGGGGGDGAISVSAAASGFAVSLPDIPKLSLGSRAGGGGNAAGVVVNNNVQLLTSGDFSPGLLAQSVGGGGGVGGTKINGDFSFDPKTGVGISLGATGVNGAGGGNAGAVSVSEGAAMATTQFNQLMTGTFGLNSPDILAQSVGGGGGTGGWSFAVGAKALQAPELGPALALAFGGTGGTGGTSGDVTVSGVSNMISGGDNSQGVFAQSVGGGGGNGGLAVGVSLTNQGNKFSLGAVTASFGGAGGSGNTAGNVSVATLDNSNIVTTGNSSQGIFAQSVGGGGGNGGGSVAVSAAVGPESGSSASIAHGGNGGTGGSAGTVTVNNAGSILTGQAGLGTVWAQSSLPANLVVTGNDSPAIQAQSVGGGGGNAGFSISTDITALSKKTALGVSVSLGGTGGSGNTAGAVTVSSTNSSATLQTTGDRSSGVFAQSVGGGGGSGGFSVSANLSTQQSVSLSMGGNGGSGANAGAVSVTNDSTIVAGTITSCATSDSGCYTVATMNTEQSYGIQAQSIGGGGGSGGFSVVGDVTVNSKATGNTGAAASVGVSLGGSGGGGGDGGKVTVINQSSILTGGNRAAAILAQSVGGGGGNGGFSVSGSLSYSSDSPAVGVMVALGGGGGAGGVAGNVGVTTSGPASPGSVNKIVTLGADSPGIQAQSVSDGGGSGAFAAAGGLPLVTKGMPIFFFLGGDSGTGHASGSATVSDGSALVNGSLVANAAGATSIATSGARSAGIVAQSITGGGGIGAISIGGDVSGGGASRFHLGAKNSDSAAAAAVTATSSSTITTSGTDSHGIVAQSIGGGGGILNFNVNGKADWQAQLDVGGNNVAGHNSADGGSVTVTTAGPTISTTGDRSSGIVAQSIGGGGGIGSISVAQSTAAPLTLAITGYTDQGGADAGDAGLVAVSNSAALSVKGLNSHGIIAQSIGGGGGIGISNATTTTTSVGGNANTGTVGQASAVTVTNSGTIATFATASYGIIAQSVGAGGGLADYAAAASQGIDLSSSGRNHQSSTNLMLSGSGGEVTVTNNAAITTKGDRAVGVFAQSVGGSGGLDLALGKAVGGYGDGKGGDVNVTNNGAISTTGSAAHGIVAQSIGGDQQGGNVTVTAAANITAMGAGSYGILAQGLGGGTPSGSAAPNMVVSVNRNVTVTGGTGPGAGIAFTYANAGFVSIDNNGTITNASGVDGTAVLAANPGGAQIDNYGTTTGSIVLGPASGLRSNEVVNHVNATLNSGAAIDLASVIPGGGQYNGAQFKNLGVFSPYGPGRIGTTTIKGADFWQTPTASGSFAGSLNVDVDAKTGASDLVIVEKGTATLGGKVVPSFLNATSLRPGTPVSAVIVQSALGGVVDSGLASQSSAVMTYQLSVNNGRTTLNLTATPNFAPAVLAGNQQKVGNAINGLLTSGRTIGGSTTLSDALLSKYIALPDAPSLGKAYEKVMTTLSVKGVSSATTDVTHALMALPMSRMQSLTDGNGGGTNTASSGDALSRLGLLAYSGSNYNLASLLDPTPVTEKRDRFGIWIEPFDHRAHNESDPVNTFASKSFGASGGVDYMFSDHLVAGIGISSVQTKVTFDDGDVNGENRSQYASVYGGYASGATNAQGVLSYGSHHYNNTRTLDLGVVTLNPTSSFNGKSISAAFTLSHAYQMQSYRIQPFATVSYNRVKMDGSQEVGAGGLELNVEGHQTNSLISDLGMRLSKSFDVASGTLIPGILASWKHEHTKGTSSLPTSLAAASDVSWAVENQHTIKNRSVLGAELQFVKEGGTVASLSFTTEHGGGYSANALHGYLRTTF